MKNHKHNWKKYSGLLGYESLVCSICGIDQNDLRAKKRIKI